MTESDMIAYKLTDIEGYTRRGSIGETLWTAGATVHPTGTGNKACGPGVLHAYISPEVAVLADPVHARYGPTVRLFRIRSEQSWQTDGLKRWTAGPVCVLEELPLPNLTREERVAWMIVHCPHHITHKWAVDWLAGHNRSVVAAGRAAAAALDAAMRMMGMMGSPKRTEAQRTEARRTAAQRAATAAPAMAAARAATAAQRMAAALPAVDAERPWDAMLVDDATATAAATAVGTAQAAEARLLLTLVRARAILAGQWPAERAWDDLEVLDG